jgi:hypothetical protein
MKYRWIFMMIVIGLAVFLGACAAPESAVEPAPQSEEEAAPAEETAPDEVVEEPADSEPAAPEASPTAEMSDVPIYAGAEDYKTTNNGTYISYVIPDVAIADVIKFYQDELAADGWEQKNKKDSGFGESITILRSKPDKNISVSIDTNVVNNGVRVLITIIPK